MNRRQFIAITATGLALARPLAADPSGGGWIDYEPDLIRHLLGEGKTVLVDYAAKWCATCQTQQQIIDSLRATNPAYDEAMVFVRVDWDKYGRHMVTTSRNIPRRSTLILLHGEQELGRLIASMDSGEIAGLMDLGTELTD